VPERRRGTNSDCDAHRRDKAEPAADCDELWKLQRPDMWLSRTPMLPAPQTPSTALSASRHPMVRHNSTGP
jgi:hypothetical protein